MIRERAFPYQDGGDNDQAAADVSTLMVAWLLVENRLA